MKDHKSSVEQHFQRKNQSKGRDNAYFEYLNHWKGLPSEGTFGDQRNHVVKHNFVLQHGTQGT